MWPHISESVYHCFACKRDISGLARIPQRVQGSAPLATGRLAAPSTRVAHAVPGQAAATEPRSSGPTTTPAAGRAAGDPFDLGEQSRVRGLARGRGRRGVIETAPRKAHELASSDDGEAKGPEMSDNGPPGVAGSPRSPFFSASSSMVSWPTLRSSDAICAPYSCT